GAIEIYLKGAKRSDEDTLKLADLALQSQNVDMVQEAFRNASPAARQRFFAEGGADKIMLAFLMDPEAHSHAMEFARSGELSVTTLINENQSWAGDNEAAIEKALAGLNASQREDYFKGELADSGSISAEDQRALKVYTELHDSAVHEKAIEKALAGLNASQREDYFKGKELADSLKFYTELHDSLVDAGNASEVARWEDMVAHPGGSLVSKLMEHRGSIYDDSAGDVIKTIEGMSKEDWERLKGPEGAKYRAEIESGLNTYLSKNDVLRCMEIVKLKTDASTFEEASVFGRRSVEKALEDSAGFFNDNEDQVYDAISKMTPAEQDRYRDRYRNDEGFRKALDEQIAGILDEGSERDSAAPVRDQ